MERSVFCRRSLIQSALFWPILRQIAAAVHAAPVSQEGEPVACAQLHEAVDRGLVRSATLHVVRGKRAFSRAFGAARTENAMFLLGSISKPVAVAALMRLYDRAGFRLEDPVAKFLPKFAGEGREAVTLRHVLTHVSGLPDQVRRNAELRRSHAPLSEFVAEAQRTPLGFVPGSRYEYSSMGILLAARVAEVISGTDILTLVQKSIFEPLQMHHSAQGLGRFTLGDFEPVQTEFAAPEAGGGDPTAKDWDWNSGYWRALGAPWGGTHCSAPDVGRFLTEFLREDGTLFKPETARMIVANQAPQGTAARGLGFDLGLSAGLPGCSERTFGHTGSTGTICWADPATQTLCVVLTSLPARAVSPHPRDLAAARVSAG
jgi:CubicO group peptidase (beta-lactamase class C family)